MDLSKIKALPKKLYDLARNNLCEIAVIAGGAHGGDLFLGGSYGAAVGCVAGIAYVMLAKKAKNK